MALSQKSSTLPANLRHAPPRNDPEQGGFLAKLKKKFKFRRGRYDVGLTTGECENISAVSFKQTSQEEFPNQSNSEVKLEGFSSDKLFAGGPVRSQSEKYTSTDHKSKKYTKLDNLRSVQGKHSQIPFQESGPADDVKHAGGNNYSFLQYDADLSNTHTQLGQDTNDEDQNIQSHDETSCPQLISALDVDPGYETLDEVRKRAQLNVSKLSTDSTNKETWQSQNRNSSIFEGEDSVIGSKVGEDELSVEDLSIRTVSADDSIPLNTSVDTRLEDSAVGLSVVGSMDMSSYDQLTMSARSKDSGWESQRGNISTPEKKSSNENLVSAGSVNRYKKDEDDNDLALLDPGYAECADAIKGSESSLSMDLSVDNKSEDGIEMETGYAECADAIKNSLSLVKVSPLSRSDAALLTQVPPAGKRSNGNMSDLYANPQILFRKLSKMTQKRNSGDFSRSGKEPFDVPEKSKSLEILPKSSNSASKEKHSPPPLPARNYSLYIDGDEELSPNLDAEKLSMEIEDSIKNENRNDRRPTDLLKAEEKLLADLSPNCEKTEAELLLELSRMTENSDSTETRVEVKAVCVELNLTNDSADGSVCEASLINDRTDGSVCEASLTNDRTEGSVCEASLTNDRTDESVCEANLTNDREDISVCVANQNSPLDVLLHNSADGHMGENVSNISKPEPSLTTSERDAVEEQGDTLEVIVHDKQGKVKVLTIFDKEESTGRRSIRRSKTEMSTSLEETSTNHTPCIEDSNSDTVQRPHNIYVDANFLSEPACPTLKLSFDKSDSDDSPEPLKNELFIDESKFVYSVSESRSSIGSLGGSHVLMDSANDDVFAAAGIERNLSLQSNVSESVESESLSHIAEEERDSISEILDKSFNCVEDNFSDIGAKWETDVEEKAEIHDTIPSVSHVENSLSLPVRPKVICQNKGLRGENNSDESTADQPSNCSSRSDQNLLYKETEPTHMTMAEAFADDHKDRHFKTDFSLPTRDDCLFHELRTSEPPVSESGSLCFDTTSIGRSLEIPDISRKIIPLSTSMDSDSTSYNSTSTSQSHDSEHDQSDAAMASSGHALSDLDDNDIDFQPPSRPPKMNLSECSMEGGAEAAPPAIPPRKKKRPHIKPVATIHRDFMESMRQLKDCGWYWGPLSWEEAEAKLSSKSEGSFLVRDSSDERYILSLSFKNNDRVHHTRIEHHRGQFSFWSQPDSHGKSTIKDFIEQCVHNSRNGRFLYFIRPSGPGAPPLPIFLLTPVSRFIQMQSLQHMCRFRILQLVRRDHIETLPVPTRIKGYLKEAQYYVEYLDD